jgi:hypothetical protein
MKDGCVFCEFTNWICGLVAGLLPPDAGWLWQEKQELELKRGPKPFCGTFSISEKFVSPA